MSELKKSTIYYTSIGGNKIIKIPTSGTNDSTVCILNEANDASTWTKEAIADQETCKLIQLLEEPVNVNTNVGSANQSIGANITDKKCMIYSEKKITCNRQSRQNHDTLKADALDKYRSNNSMNRQSYMAKTDKKVKLQKLKDHSYSDSPNNKIVKGILQSQDCMINNTVVGYPLMSTNDTKDMCTSTNTNLISQVKNINDLKKVIPKVKIFGAEVNTLQELSRTNCNNKLSIGEDDTIKLTDAKEKLRNYCRTCAGLKIPLVDIFSDRGIQMRLNQQMKHLENINQHDSLSTQMCMDCICDLKMSYKFFMQIKKAQVKLKSIHTSLITVASMRQIDNKANIQHNNNLANILKKCDNTQRSSIKLNKQQSSQGLIYTGNEIYDTTINMKVESVNDLEIVKNTNNNDAESIEEFDPDDDGFHSVEYANDEIKSDIEFIKREDKMEKEIIESESTIIVDNLKNNLKDSEMNDNNVEINIKKEIFDENNINSTVNIKKEPESIVFNPCYQAPLINDKFDITREVNNKQPNILKRKSSYSSKAANITNNVDLIGKDAKIPKLNTVNISPSDEEGIMYVTVKGTKPNELLLVKVKKMDKSIEKKDDKSCFKKLNDTKIQEKLLKTLPLKDLFNERSKTLENREAIIEEQIEEYKKKREKVLGGTSGSEAAASIAACAIPVMSSTIEAARINDNTSYAVNFGDDTMKNSLSENSLVIKDELIGNICEMNDDNIEIKIGPEADDNNDNEYVNDDNERNSDDYESTKEYLAPLMKIKHKWEAAKLKKESLQKELDNSCTESNIEKLSRILGEKQRNLKEFQEYLKQRKIVITRLKDQDIISLYEDRNISFMNDKLPDLIDDKSLLFNIGDINRFDCDYCPQIFSTRSTLEDHLKTHDYKIFYFCEGCGSEFPNNKARRTHNITCFKKLVCKYCDLMLGSTGKKRQHEQKHCDSLYGQLCDICGEKFKHQGTLDQHVKTQHMNWEKVFQCPKCPKKFAFKQKLSFHLKSVHTTLRAYLCEDCGADFKNPASLRHHRIRKHQPTSNKRECQVCHKLVPFYSLSKHMYTHKAYTIHCPHCSKMFKNTSTLKQHVRIHEDQRQYRCDTCGVGFNRRDGLRLHMRVHQKSDSRALKECSCQICSEKFPNHSMLVIHRNRVHKDGKQYTCHICNRSMLSTRSLEWHMSHIHNETPTGIAMDDPSNAVELKRVSCNHCDKTFKTEMILRTHIKNTHMEKNPVKCSDCDLMFTSEVRLRHHMMIIHNRLEGTLTCPHCPKRFVNQLRLKTHLISHSEERPYTCELCGFNLKTKIQLIKHHQNRHSDERPLKCKYCTWRCKQVSALVCHERTHTNERPYSCSVCKQRFKYLGDKNKHERRHESLGGSGFKRNIAGRNVKHPKHHDEVISASENDPEYESIDGQLCENVEYDEQQIVNIEGHEMDNEEQDEMQALDIEQQQQDNDEMDEYDDDEEIEEKMVHQQQQEEDETEMDDEYKQAYKHGYEEISREASEAAEVIMNMEDATVYTEEVTAENIENAELITAEMISNQILQTGTVVHIQQQDDDGKIQVIPVMLSLPDLTDSTAEINLATGSIMYSN